MVSKCCLLSTDFNFENKNRKEPGPESREDDPLQRNLKGSVIFLIVLVYYFIKNFRNDWKLSKVLGETSSLSLK